ncbi:MAG: dihydrolipoyllysine-residue acetyltransferase [Porticoccaceae bacterium]|nr:MAG: dihydrolipoyllysine-residue acetyltransferase [Porticoccaceae bacterium]
MTTETIHVPDLGGAESVEVIELCVAPGDVVEVEQSLIILESDKATMDVPSPKAGTVKTLVVKEGDIVSEGAAIVELELESELKEEVGDTVSDTSLEEINPEGEVDSVIDGAVDNVIDSVKETSAVSGDDGPGGSTVEQVVCVPDTGTEEAIEIIELAVSPGDILAEGDSILVVETDKATMEIPTDIGGEVLRLLVKEGDKVHSGDEIVVLAIASSMAESEDSSSRQKGSEKDNKLSEPSILGNAPILDSAPLLENTPTSAPDSGSKTTGHEVAGLLPSSTDVYAGPASRALARELGVDLHKVKGTGPRGRILKDDLNDYVKNAVAIAESGSLGAAAGAGIPAIPDVDFSKFGEIEMIPLQKIQKLTAANLHRSWVNVPHVTQFDEADITDLEEFRQSLKAEAEKRGSRLTPLPFLLKACAHAMVANPEFNRSITSNGESFVQKKYVHIGIAVDTPRGLVVPVIRDVDTKGLWQLAIEVNEMAAKARDGKLSANDMQGGCFTISSLGAIGGNGFTPIVNTPEAGILGVSKSQMKPVWNGSEFIPRMMLPLSISYDHRVINGADCGRFFTYLVQELGDTRRLAL